MIEGERGRRRRKIEGEKGGRERKRGSGGDRVGEEGERNRGERGSG